MVITNENIIIANPKKLEQIKAKIKKAGANKLQVISDFDRTITYGLDQGERTATVISQLRSDPKYLGEDYAKKAKELFAIYNPIEIDESIPPEKKQAKMREWWKKHFDLIIEKGLTKKIIQQVIKERPLRFRKGSKKFMKTLDEKTIPLIFISASSGDMLLEYLKKDKLLYSNIWVLANKYKFDSNGKTIEIQEPIIHTYNKKETSLKHHPKYNQLKKRTNIILLGDETGDADMAEGFPYKNIIKIGFLNEKIPERLETYKVTYDIVLLKDQNMDYVNELLREIIK